MQTYMAWAVPILLILVGGFGGYLAGYMKKKGENLATREDIDKVFAETKRIEAKISDDVWDRQKRWELKRDLLLDAIKKIAGVRENLTRLHAIYLTNIRSTNPEMLELEVRRTGVGTKWIEAIERLDEIVFLAELACDGGTVAALADFDMFARHISLEIMQGRPEIFDTSVNELAAKLNAIRAAMRKEIGIREPA
jgi:hypothetical protein